MWLDFEVFYCTFHPDDTLHMHVPFASTHLHVSRTNSKPSSSWHWTCVRWAFKGGRCQSSCFAKQLCHWWSVTSLTMGVADLIRSNGRTRDAHASRTCFELHIRDLARIRITGKTGGCENTSVAIKLRHGWRIAWHAGALASSAWCNSATLATIAASSFCLLNWSNAARIRFANPCGWSQLWSCTAEHIFWRLKSSFAQRSTGSPWVYRFPFDALASTAMFIRHIRNQARIWSTCEGSWCQFTKVACQGKDRWRIAISTLRSAYASRSHWFAFFARLGCGISNSCWRFTWIFIAWPKSWTQCTCRAFLCLHRWWVSLLTLSLTSLARLNDEWTSHVFATAS